MSDKYSNRDGLAPPSGLLHEKISLEHFDLLRVTPSNKLSHLVENYWVIQWDLRQKPDFTQYNLPHPSVNLVIDPFAKTGVFGVQKSRFAYHLSGTGRLFGVKFRPGAFHGYLKRSVSTLTDRHVSVASIFAAQDAELEREFLRVNDPLDFARTIESLLLCHSNSLDNKACKARELVDMITKDKRLMNVCDLAAKGGMGVRSLQRLFEIYVGVTPKWVIDRARMLAAVDALNGGKSISLTELAHGLGYFDSAHFGRAFQVLTGYSPSQYQARL